MKAFIIGSGAVGCAIAIATVKAGMETSLIARSDTAEYIRKNGLKRVGIFGEETVLPGTVSVFEDYGQIPSDQDFIVITVKTMSNEIVAEELNAHPDIVGKNGRLIILQNGWGVNEHYLKAFPDSRIFNARVMTGFEPVSKGTTRITVHKAPLLIGSLYGQSVEELLPLTRAISASGIASETTDELEQALWAKMLYNTTLNPLGAILNMSYGELSESPNLVNIMNDLIEETFRVMNATGYKTYWDNAHEYREVLYNNLIPDTYSHHSSTLQDIQNHQKTEIDTLNGCIQRIGRENGIATPTHDMIVSMIRGIEDICCRD